MRGQERIGRAMHVPRIPTLELCEPKRFAAARNAACGHTAANRHARSGRNACRLRMRGRRAAERESERLALRHPCLRDTAREGPYAQDVTLAFGDPDRTARVEHVERVRSL